MDQENRENFDLSDSLREDMKDNTNKKVPCKVKDEMNTLAIKEFTGVAPKSYSYIKATLEEMACSRPHLYKYYENAKDKILTEINGEKLKGVSKAVVKNEIENKNYVDVLTASEPVKRNVTAIRSFDHQLYTYKAKKVALTGFYDKLEMVLSLIHI